MTSEKHERCTDRIAEASQDLDVDFVINIQGDEPMTSPEMVEDLVKVLIGVDDLSCVNLISPIKKEEEFDDPNVVKTVVDKEGYVLYYSRSPIPSKWKAPGSFDKFKQLGIIAFSKDLLLMYPQLEPTPLEIVESVDMLRLLEHGYRVKTAVSDYKTYGVDTLADLQKVEDIMREDPLCKRYMDGLQGGEDTKIHVM
jgi:3-deoxy-manno-octulosonate cytidylyltransferase (CMP-KDO synthetase)